MPPLPAQPNPRGVLRTGRDEAASGGRRGGRRVKGEADLRGQRGHFTAGTLHCEAGTLYCGLGGTWGPGGDRRQRDAPGLRPATPPPPPPGGGGRRRGADAPANSIVTPGSSRNPCFSRFLAPSPRPFGGAHHASITPITSAAFGTEKNGEVYSAPPNPCNDATRSKQSVSNTGTGGGTGGGDGGRGGWRMRNQHA